MKTRILQLIWISGGMISATSYVLAADEGMRSMSTIHPKKTFSVQSVEQGQDLEAERGFGEREPEVRMMNLMMVEGSGMEGMDMGQIHGDVSRGARATSSPSPSEGQTSTYDIQTKITPDPPKVGSNTLEVLVQKRNEKKPAIGLKLTAQVSMSSMDMGTEEPKIREVSPGKYQVKVTFSMAGPWAVKLTLPEGSERILEFNAGSSKQ